MCRFGLGLLVSPILFECIRRIAVRMALRELTKGENYFQLMGVGILFKSGHSMLSMVCCKAMKGPIESALEVSLLFAHNYVV